MTDDSVFRQMLLDPSRREEGFRALLGQYGRRLYWHIRRIVVGHDDAEDVMQETCIKILNRIGSFNGDSPLLTWLYRVATNEALMHLRRQTHLFQSIDALGESLTARLQADPPHVGSRGRGALSAGPAHLADPAAHRFQPALLRRVGL